MKRTKGERERKDRRVGVTHHDLLRDLGVGGSVLLAHSVHHGVAHAQQAVGHALDRLGHGGREEHGLAPSGALRALRGRRRGRGQAGLNGRDLLFKPHVQQAVCLIQDEHAHSAQGVCKAGGGLDVVHAAPGRGH